MKSLTLKTFGSRFGFSVMSIFALAFFVSSCEKKESATQQSDSAPQVAKAEKQAEELVVKEDEQPLKPVVDTVEPVQEKVTEQEVKPIAERAAVAAKVSAPVDQVPVEIVTDPALIKVPDGSDRPKKGDKIYTYTNLPKDACGTYWVRGGNGMVETLAVCRDEH